MRMLLKCRLDSAVFSLRTSIAVRLAVLTLLLCTSVACTKSTEFEIPVRESGVPPLGRYDYTGWYTSGSRVAVSGSFTITYAALDSIAGIWDVPQYRNQSSFPEGAFRLAHDAYGINSEVIGVGSLDHLLSWDGVAFSCSAQLRTSGHFAFNLSPGGCTLSTP